MFRESQGNHSELKKTVKGEKIGILPRNRFIIFDRLTFRLEWRDDGRSVCSSSSGLWHFGVVLVHGSVQQPIRIRGRNQVVRLIV